MRRRGRVNEDSFTVMGPDDGRALLTVADGVGGAASGNQASALVVEAAREFRPADDIAGALRSVASRANEAVRELQRSSAEHDGAGSTLVAAYIDGDSLWTANVGDSRVYRLRQGRLEQLTEDHSYVQEEVRAGRLTREEARTHRRANIITRNIGGEERVDAEIERSTLQRGDVVVVCSDGLNGPLRDDEIRDVILRERGRPATTAQALIDAANVAGGPDNVTAVVARLGGEDISPMAAPSAGDQSRTMMLPLIGGVAALLVLALLAAFVVPGFLRGDEAESEVEPTASATVGIGAVPAGPSIPVRRSDERGVIFSQFVGLSLDEQGNGCDGDRDCIALDWGSSNDALLLIEQVESELGADLQDASIELQRFQARTEDAWEAALARSEGDGDTTEFRTLVVADLLTVDGAPVIQVAGADHWIFAELPGMAPFLAGQTVRVDEVLAGVVDVLIVPGGLAERVTALDGVEPGSVVSVPGLELPFVPLLQLDELGRALVNGLDGISVGAEPEEPAAVTETPTATATAESSGTPAGSGTPASSATPEGTEPATETATPAAPGTPDSTASPASDE